MNELIRFGQRMRTEWSPVSRCGLNFHWRQGRLAWLGLVLVLGLSGTLGANDDKSAPSDEQPAEVIVGTIVTPELAPVVGIEVLAFEGGKQLDQKFRTDEQGQFRVPKAWGTSDHYLTLVARDGHQRLAWFDFFLNAHSNDGQKRANGSFQLELLPISHVVRGTIVDEAGVPLAGIPVQVEQLQHETNFLAVHWQYQKIVGEPLIAGGTTDHEGKFEIRLPSESSAVLGVVDPDWVKHRFAIVKSLDNAGTIKLARATKIAGRVVDSRTGKPMANVGIHAQAIEPVLSGGWGETRTDLEGKYVIGGLACSQFNVYTTPFADQRMLAPASTVTTSESGKTYEADFSLSVGQSLSGRVVDIVTGQPIPNQQVKCESPARPGTAILTTESNDQGEFELFVLPGKNLVSATEGRQFGPESSREIEVTGEVNLEPFNLQVGPKLEELGLKIFVGSPLDRKVTIDFENRPLVEALETLCMAAAVKLELDEDRLVSVGYSKETPVTARSGRILLQDALQQVLKPFERLSFTLDGDKIFVSTQQRVKARANGRVNDGRPRTTGNASKPKKAVNPFEPLSGEQSKLQSRLQQVFNDSVDEVPASEVLADIAKTLDVKLELDHAGIWAGGGNEEMLSLPITLMDVCERFISGVQAPNRPDWMQLMFARGDGTIRINEALMAILEPMGLDYRVAGDVLFVSSYEEIALLRNPQDSDSDIRPQRTDEGLRTRIVIPWSPEPDKPLELKVETRNFSASVRDFDLGSVSPDRSIEVTAPDGKPIRFRGDPVKNPRTRTSIKPGETV